MANLNAFALLDDENEDPRTLAAKKPAVGKDAKAEAPKAQPNQKQGKQFDRFLQLSDKVAHLLACCIVNIFVML